MAACRKTTLNGRDYYVVPMTMIKPGVLNGSQGRLFYPPDEVGKSPEIWNHIPIVVYHTFNGGKPVSARDPAVLERQGIGYVFKSRVSNSGNLQAEGWIDIEKARAVDPRVIARIESGQPIELSTGLFTENEKAEPGAKFGNRPYDYIARNYRPDHLAILPDQVGACSLSDGCGVLVNFRSGQTMIFNTTAAPPPSRRKTMVTFNADEREVLIDAILDDLVVNGCDCHESDREALNNVSDEVLANLYINKTDASTRTGHAGSGDRNSGGVMDRQARGSGKMQDDLDDDDIERLVDEYRNKLKRLPQGNERFQLDDSDDATRLRRGSFPSGGRVAQNHLIPPTLNWKEIANLPQNQHQHPVAGNHIPHPAARGFDSAVENRSAESLDVLPTPTGEMHDPMIAAAQRRFLNRAHA